ncbi:uncharacterized protein Dwil_GK14109 [Drosophila willistoni]|uniref:Complex III assembly factor LYRM7 n=1 Tax=Drosophila willistoni TaxID=7260 RepID=B4NGP7_DROWI|nr:complex III assembly factor LYRM7 [Drosophila willistoni]EDW84394.1 uncharacterized protein Dwil_GK14109 [Drosophila willistoni]
MSQLRRQVLNAFKRLHRTRQHVFDGDIQALTAGRLKINESFRQNRDETKEDEIKKMIQLADDVSHELRTTVIQATKREDNVYELRISDETTRLDNVLFNPDAEIKAPRRRRQNQESGCCGGAAMAALEQEIQERKK